MVTSKSHKCANIDCVSGKGHKKRIVIVIVCGCGFLFLVALRPNAGRGLLIHEVYRSHTTTLNVQYDSSGVVISSSQRPQPGRTQHFKETFVPPAVFEPTFSAEERTQTCALNGADSMTSVVVVYVEYIYIYILNQASCVFETHENTVTVIRIKLALKEGMPTCVTYCDVGKGWRTVGTG